MINAILIMIVFDKIIHIGYTFYNLKVFLTYLFLILFNLSFHHYYIYNEEIYFFIDFNSSYKIENLRLTRKR